MSIFSSFQSIKSVNIYRKPIVVIAIVAITIGFSTACGKEPIAGSNTPSETEALSKQIKDVVKGLEYSDKVGVDFVKMVGGWKDKQGQPVLVVWKNILTEAKEAYKRGKTSKVQLAKIEDSVAKEISQRIQKEIGIDFSKKFFDLTDVIKNKQAQCLGYSQLIYILGNSVGLSVKAIYVVELSTGALPTGSGHVACIIDLVDNKVVMVDLAFGPIISKPFKLEEQFAKVGNYWELKDKDNPLGIHRRIQILDRNVLTAGIYNNRGADYADLGQHTKAISDYTKAIELNPKYAGAYSNRGVAYRELGQYPKAISDYTKAIQLNPKFAGAYNNRGDAYVDLGQFTQAISDLTKAISLNPKYAEAYNNRGNAYAKLGQSTKAFSDYTKAIELNPKLAELYYNRGNTYFKLGQQTKAISDYTKAIQLNPKLSEVYNNRGNIYFNLGQHTKAISDFAKVIELNPKYAKAYYIRGLAQAFLGNFEKARKDLLKSVELDPSLKTRVKKISDYFKLNLQLD